MKVLSIAIPCYNSQDYMRHAVETALVGGEDVEILLINDGSTDQTPQIADELAAEHPTIVRAIHKENGGLSDARNAGLDAAGGEFMENIDRAGGEGTAVFACRAIKAYCKKQSV